MSGSTMYCGKEYGLLYEKCQYRDVRIPGRRRESNLRRVLGIQPIMRHCVPARPARPSRSSLSRCASSDRAAMA